MLFKTLLALPALWAVMSTGEPKTLDEISEDYDGLNKEMKALRNITGTLIRQVMLQQQFVEERIRSEGDSGIKLVRLYGHGTKMYHASSHVTGRRVAAVHDHANNERAIGLGEFIAVLNGVEFRTRHNDYSLMMPHKTGKGYHATEPIPFPEVPPEVTNKTTVDEQVQEMREWFKAWKYQDHRVRDYRKYFKPVLCYLEGAWTTTTKDIDEPFESDRHFIDASSWFDLQEKVRFASYTGRKDNLENFSFLPTTIIDIINDIIPVYAQWNYRILCHPIKRDLPLNRFRVINDLQSRMASGREMWAQTNSRAARFQLNPRDRGKWKEGGVRWSLLDKLMSEIPGKDNYPGNLRDNAFGLTVHSLVTGKESNTAFYHHGFKVMKKGAMGLSKRGRGFNDPSLYAAMTTQPQVAGMTLKTCKNRKKCKDVHQKFSYAIPLEIIYMTPLSRWNPFDIEYKGKARSRLGRTVKANGRNGGKTLNTAYDGVNNRAYYLTPSAFFTGGEVGTDAADTTKGTVGVLNKKGNVSITRASGTRIFLPSIAGVGILRQRYPIMPVHGHGSSVWKELEATKEILMKSKTFSHMFIQPLPTSSSRPVPSGTIRLSTQTSKLPISPGPHHHELTLTGDEAKMAKRGHRTTKVTEKAAGHNHTVTFRSIKRRGKTPRWKIYRCDAYDTFRSKCWDHHGRFLNVIAG